MSKTVKTIIFFCLFVIFCFGLSFNKVSAFGSPPPNVPSVEELSQYLRNMHNLDEIKEGTFNLTIRPSNPVAGEKIIAHLQTNHDSNKALISWYLDGSLQAEGYGLNRFDFNVGKIGEKTILEANIITDTGVKRRKRIEIIPAEVDILWQTSTYTPAPYKGKNLSPSTDKGIIQFVALPKFTNDEKIENPNDFVFHWSLNGNKRTDLSGRGRNMIEVDLNDIFRKDSASVTVEHLNKDQIASRNIVMLSTNIPEVLIYKKDRYGIDYSLAINHSKQYRPTERNLDFVSKPFYFNEENLDALDITWSMNRKPLTEYTDSKKSSFIIERDFVGTTLVSIEVKNPNNFRERVSSNFSIIVDSNAF